MNILHASIRADSWAARYVSAMHGFPRCFSFSCFIRCEHGPSPATVKIAAKHFTHSQYFYSDAKIYAPRIVELFYIANAFLKSWNGLILNRIFFSLLCIIYISLCAHLSIRWMFVNASENYTAFLLKRSRRIHQRKHALKITSEINYLVYLCE